MKKLLFALILAFALVSCGKAYNDSLKQIQLGMSSEQVVALMGDKYNVVSERDYNNKTIEYADRYKNNWNFEFVDGKLHKWYKIKE